MIDERKNNGQLETARYKMRKKIEEELGKNSRRARNKVIETNLPSICPT